MIKLIGGKNMCLIDKNSEFSYLNNITNSEIIENIRDSFFVGANCSVETYWIEQESDSVGLKEYKFDNLTELEAMLTKSSDLFGSMRAIAVDAFRKRRDFEASRDRNKTEMTIPDYVYTF